MRLDVHVFLFCLFRLKRQMLLVYAEALFFCETGKTVSLDPKSNISVPEDRDGLYAIDILDPDLVFVVSYICFSHVGCFYLRS